ncbi:MAG TPA: hypothetical protein VNS32_18215 [Flavisolibacter sp.]|nr:hypothetical protein [Flavisolibacter sp.]
MTGHDSATNFSKDWLKFVANKGVWIFLCTKAFSNRYIPVGLPAQRNYGSNRIMGALKAFKFSIPVSIETAIHLEFVIVK